MPEDFSLWCDFVQKDFLRDEFVSLVRASLIQGATSNPSIFAKAFATPVYEQAIAGLRGKNKKSIYEELACADIQRAAEILKPLWERDKALGYISLEIDPFLCDEASKSIDEGKRLYKRINMPNVMIKVPATQAGYEVMNALAKEGINVNATLVFSPKQAKECALALQQGIHYASSPIQAVISVFVSRFDRAVDSQLEAHLRAKCGIINAMDCYEVIESFKAPAIRTLFASTGVKDGDLEPSYYIDSLIFPHSVNTAPLDAIRAFEKSQNKAQKLLMNAQNRLAFWESLQNVGISRQSLSQNLLDEGLSAFCASFEEMLRAL